MKCNLCDKKIVLLTNQLRNSKGKVYYCSKCDIGILKNKPKNIKEYYKREYRKKFKDSIKKLKINAKEIYQFRKNYQEDRLKIVKKYFNKDKTFLEVGCSAGQFLVHIKNKFSQCVGIEFDDSCAKFVKQKFKINVYTDGLKKCNFQDKKFDYIAAFQVLEHTENPLEFLLDMKRHLKDKGKIFIEIPNLYDPLLKLWDIKEYKKFYYHEAHTYYFSPKSIKLLCKKAGFKIEQLHFIQDYNMFNHLYWYFNDEPQKDCNFGLSQPNFKFAKEYSNVDRKMNKLFVEMDNKYKKILSDNKLTSNMLLVASKINN